ncbi:unnamed protein product [Cyprideis torosa]|uniref:Uncharacterized protein n=1 Tax=Cyprideis torosa TaxID=163714 RepID=A0A7R8WEV4_9CRUS|nr:unnamed protein product [Cyprideis torosa]CAG0896243.1 unnamed protein product [Cyprideis torosa]
MKSNSFSKRRWISFIISYIFNFLGGTEFGFGSGTATVMFAEMARATNMAEKTRVMTVAFACRQVSILLGPAYNLALRNLDFQLGPFLVNEESSPGLLLAILWIIMEFIVWMFYGHPSKEFEEEQQQLSKRDLVIQTPHLVTLFFAQFVAFFTLCFIEGALPPTFQYFFGFGSYEVSLLFLVMGAEAIMVYIIAWLLASRVSDRTFLSCGMTAVFASLIALLVYDCLAMTPGFGQGFRRFVTSVGVTLGPLWAGGMFYNRVVFYLVPIFIMALALLFCALSYREFAPRQPPQTRNVPDLSPKECTQALTSSNTPK